MKGVENNILYRMLKENEERRKHPYYRLVLHNDDKNGVDDVVRALRILDFPEFVAVGIAAIAHTQGRASCGSFPKEKAEAGQKLLAGRNLKASIESEIIGKVDL